MSKAAVAVVGAAGSQANSFLHALSRARDMDGVIAIDRGWDPATQASTQTLGCQIIHADLLADHSFLVEELTGVRLVVNLAGPFYEAGTAALELALELQADYLDICDDIDATEDLLARRSDARAAGICAIIGIGSSPGMTNILIRTALDALGGGQGVSVDLSWVIDAQDITASTLDHVLHCFATALPGEVATGEWAALEADRIGFPDPVGKREVVRLGHPETITVPRFTDVEHITNKGGVLPGEYLHTLWALARAADVGSPHEKLHEAYSHFDTAMCHEGRTRVGSGMMIDVVRNGEGYRFASGAATTMADSTGIPAAAGVLMMLEGTVPGSGVWVPESLPPSTFFTKLREVSTGGGGLHLFELSEGQPVRSSRIREILAKGSAT